LFRLGIQNSALITIPTSSRAAREDEVAQSVRMLKHLFCPCCEKPLPLRFLWSAGLRAKSCPNCNKSLRSKKSKSFVLGGDCSLRVARHHWRRASFHCALRHSHFVVWRLGADGRGLVCRFQRRSRCQFTEFVVTDSTVAASLVPCPYARFHQLRHAMALGSRITVVNRRLH
jgi:hypothetical protein